MLPISFQEGPPEDGESLVALEVDQGDGEIVDPVAVSPVVEVDGPRLASVEQDVGLRPQVGVDQSIDLGPLPPVVHDALNKRGHGVEAVGVLPGDQGDHLVSRVSGAGVVPPEARAVVVPPHEAGGRAPPRGVVLEPGHQPPDRLEVPRAHALPRHHPPHPAEEAAAPRWRPRQRDLHGQLAISCGDGLGHGEPFLAQRGQPLQLGVDAPLVLVAGLVEPQGVAAVHVEIGLQRLVSGDSDPVRGVPGVHHQPQAGVREPEGMEGCPGHQVGPP